MSDSPSLTMKEFREARQNLVDAITALCYKFALETGELVEEIGMHLVGDVEYQAVIVFSSLDDDAAPPMTTALARQPREQVVAPISDRPSQKKQQKDGRVNFRATEGLITILADLKANNDMNMSQSIRRGVSLLHIAMKEQAKGRRLAFVDEQGKVVAEVHAL
jgi:hypothetical protein